MSGAIEKWKKVMGDMHVIRDSATLDYYCSNVSALKREVFAVLRPESTQQVQTIVQIANEYKTPLYPLSCGKNLGLGSRLPVRDGAVIVDLGRMNHIREVNVEHHFAVVEAGVSQGQLYEYLAEHNLPLVLNVTGAGLRASLIGNALERGIGYFSTRADSLSGIEVVLGNGEIVRTGYAHFPNSETKHTYKYGVGPSLDGLFFQSNYGVVTSAGIDLMPKSEAHVALIASLYDEGKLGEFVEIFASLRKSGVIQTVAHMGNRHRTEITLAPLIFKALDDGRCDKDTLRKKATDLFAAEKFASWNAVIGLLGTRAQLKVALREIKCKLQCLASISLITDQKLVRSKRLIQVLEFSPYFRHKKAIMHAIEPLYGLSKGIPTDAALGSLYWPIGEVPPDGTMEPDQSPCGMLYCLPMMPLSGKFAVETMRHTEDIFRRHGFIPYVTLNMIDSRILEAVITLAFDRRRAEQVTAAHRCIEETQQYFIDEGLIPYRVGIQSMPQVVKAEDPFWKTVRDLKKVFDPNHIIAPGRYNLV